MISSSSPKIFERVTWARLPPSDPRLFLWEVRWEAIRTLRYGVTMTSLSLPLLWSSSPFSASVVTLASVLAVLSLVLVFSRSLLLASVLAVLSLVLFFSRSLLLVLLHSQVLVPALAHVLLLECTLMLWGSFSFPLCLLTSVHQASEPSASVQEVFTTLCVDFRSVALVPVSQCA